MGVCAPPPNRVNYKLARVEMRRRRRRYVAACQTAATFFFLTHGSTDTEKTFGREGGGWVDGWMGQQWVHSQRNSESLVVMTTMKIVRAINNAARINCLLHPAQKRGVLKRINNLGATTGDFSNDIVCVWLCSVVGSSRTNLSQ